MTQNVNMIFDTMTFYFDLKGILAFLKGLVSFLPKQLK